MRLLGLVLVICTVGCGGNDGPTAPSQPPPLPTAQITPSGSASWEACLSGSCLFQAEARNTGLGCAADVRGVVRFFNGQQQLVGSAQWTLGARIVRPNEAFLYRSTVYVGRDVILAANGGTYQSEPAWTNVAC